MFCNASMRVVLEIVDSLRRQSLENFYIIGKTDTSTMSVNIAIIIYSFHNNSYTSFHFHKDKYDNNYTYLQYI